MVAQTKTSGAESFGGGRNVGIGHNKADIEFTIEDIDPQTAKRMLETVPHLKNREVPKAINTYAEAMKAEGWIVNGQPIIFDQENNLVDGVQRLSACVAADKTFTTLVARNVQADTLHTIDQHRRRSYTGVLEARGYKNAGALMRTMSKLIRIENGVLGKVNVPISWSRYDRVLAANPELTEAVEEAERWRGSFLHSTPRPVLCFMALKAGLRRELEDFMSGLADPESYPLTHCGASLANQLEILRDSNAEMSVDKALGVAIVAFNAHLEGKKARGRFKWEPDFGKDNRNSQGEPISTKKLREEAPDNLGLPLVKGYPGLDEGAFDTSKDKADEFAGRIAREIREGIDADAHDEVVEMRTVTPELARQWLTDFNLRNRNIQKNHVNMIARDIENGNWMVNAQPICFTGDPDNAQSTDDVRLLNGQHRLMAVVQAEIPIDVPIAKNIPEKAFATFDTHVKRNTVTTSTNADSRVLKAAAKFMWREEQGHHPNASVNPSTTELIETLNRHEEMAEHFPRARKRIMQEIASAGVLTYFIYRVLREDRDLGEQFLEQLETGEGIQRGNPVGKARQNALTEGKKARKDKLKSLLEAWEDYKKWAHKSAEKQESLI